jgi:Reverse transcriptase (RNA-dependent DNA polymerase)
MAGKYSRGRGSRLVAPKEWFGIDELYFAYRKAKHYAFRDPNTSQGFRYADYERQLTKNLRNLHRRLNSSSFVVDEDFVGGWSSIPRWRDGQDGPKTHFYSSDPEVMWRTGKSQLEHRLIASPSVTMQVLNALWCMTAGTRIDATLSHAHVFASHPHRGATTTFASGLRASTSRQLFQYWPGQYERWQRQGLRCMRTALREGRSIVALTMDIQKFYHCLDATFLTSQEFLSAPDVPSLGFSEPESRLNQLLTSAIATWNKLAPTESVIGLPVGWTSSAVLANAALRSLDQRVLRELSPLYYGRYVDDIFLVTEPHRSFSDTRGVMAWMENKLQLKFEKGSEGTRSWNVTLPGLARSTLSFSEKKLKIFCLHGESGLDLIRPIEDALRCRASEFRSLPVLPTDDNQLAATALLTTTDAGTEADALRKAEAVSVRRHGFSLILKKAEEYRRHLDPIGWLDNRRAFFGVVRRHLIVPRGIAELSGYLPRVFSLAASTGDWKELSMWIRELRAVRSRMRSNSKRTKSNDKQLFERAWENLWEQLAEATVSGATDPIVSQQISTFRRLLRLAGQAERNFEETRDGLRLADWLIEPRLSNDATAIASQARWPAHLVPENLKALGGLKGREWSSDAMMLATRVPELAQLYRIDIDEDENIEAVFAALTTLKYGATFPSLLRCVPLNEECLPTIQINARPHSGRARLVVASLRTQVTEWMAAVHDAPLLTAARFTKLTKLLNRIMKDIVTYNVPIASYVLFPELSIPQRWATFFAVKLASVGASFLAGLEYRRSPRNRIINEAMLSFAIPQLSGNPVVLLQRKRRPSWREGREVRGAVGLDFEGSSRGFPVYIHGDLNLAVSICSDFTNVAARLKLQGAIDLLIVPEWNQDVEGFATLIEAAALDIHAFIAQINNREYGDSRVRVAAQRSWKRDLVRLRGGHDDFYAMVDIDYHELRRFQTNSEPPDEPFKPFPVGFRLHARRRLI